MGLEPHEREKLQVKMLEAQIKFNEECKNRMKRQKRSVRKHQTRLPKNAFQFVRNNSVSNWKKQLPIIIGTWLPRRISPRRWTRFGNGIGMICFTTTDWLRNNVRRYRRSRPKPRPMPRKRNTTNHEMHRQYASLVTDIASDFGETIGEMIATGELSLKNFLRETIMMALDALERVIEISILEITAKFGGNSSIFLYRCR